MPIDIDLVCSPEEAADPEKLLPILSAKTGYSIQNIQGHYILRRSIDARKNPVKINLKARLFIDETPALPESIELQYKDVSHTAEVHIIGCGPAGMFAALRCIELGLKPIILERGKNVKDRRRDLKSINRDHTVNPESNYCFGEGGAGTYSDGKLYTRSKKRGSVKRILDILVKHGAVSDILIEAHPHIGTNKLPKVVESMRETILRCGGEIHFNTRVDDLILEENKIIAIQTAKGDQIPVQSVILATGHSARDIFQLLHQKKIELKTIARLETSNEVIGIFRFPTIQKVKKSKLVLVLDQIHDPGNLGTLLRTCDWFGVNRIYCTSGTTDAYNSKCIQSTMGSIARVKVSYHENEEIKKLLGSRNIWVADMVGQNFEKLPAQTNGALVLGNESHGPSEFWRNHGEAVTIKRHPRSRVESLNVAQAAAILISNLSS